MSSDYTIYILPNISNNPLKTQGSRVQNTKSANKAAVPDVSDTLRSPLTLVRRTVCLASRNAI